MLVGTIFGRYLVLENNKIQSTMNCVKLLMSQQLEL